MSTTVDTATSHGGNHNAVLAEYGKGRRRVVVQGVAVLALVLIAAAYVNLLDIATLARGVPAILAIMRESFPPDFSNAADWWKPLIDTLAMHSRNGYCRFPVVSARLPRCPKYVTASGGFLLRPYPA